ncbi:hypothetical protein HYE41_03785 [Mycoplasmopsis bovis]|nr:hypothetical protein [Mycoplasmopsis bovis]QQH20751.1 hypothetical protein HYE41_03785 [Mycoplasmopsis bovis]
MWWNQRRKEKPEKIKIQAKQKAWEKYKHWWKHRAWQKSKWKHRARQKSRNGNTEPGKNPAETQKPTAKIQDEDNATLKQWCITRKIKCSENGKIKISYQEIFTKLIY